MQFKSFDYYGYDKDSYKSVRSMVASANRHQILLLNLWFSIMVLCYVVFSGMNLFGVTQERIIFYTIYFFLSVLFTSVLVIFKKFSEKYDYIMLYTSIAILLSYGILVSVAHPYMPAVIYMIFITLISLMYIHTMWRIGFVILLSSGIFLYCSYRYKTFSIAYNDTYNLVVVVTLALGLHYMFQKNRLSQFVLYKQNLRIQNELEIKSSFDSLSGLLNRGSFFSIAEKILIKQPDKYKVLCLFDLDGFKQINDTYGHQMGDKAIQVTGQTLLKSLKLDKYDKSLMSKWDFKIHGDVAGRLGGDEFIILLNGLKDREGALSFLEEILKSLNSVNVGELSGIQASLGVTEIKSGEFDVDTAYTRADAALYESKRAGKNQIHFFEDGLSGDEK